MRIVLDDADLRQLPITIDPEIVSGMPVFRDTRVPVEALVTNLEDGMSLEEFLDNFPSVSREQAVQVLEFLNVTLQKLASAYLEGLARRIRSATRLRTVCRPCLP